MSEKTMGQLEEELRSAGDILSQREQETSIARSSETEARNKYNEACKAFDKAVAALKKDAPQDSDWGRR